MAGSCATENDEHGVCSQRRTRDWLANRTALGVAQLPAGEVEVLSFRSLGRLGHCEWPTTDRKCNLQPGPLGRRACKDCNIGLGAAVPEAEQDDGFARVERMAQGHHLGEIDIRFARGEAAVHCLLPGCHVKASCLPEIFAEAFRRVLRSGQFHTCRTVVERRLGLVAARRSAPTVPPGVSIPGCSKGPGFSPRNLTSSNHPYIIL